MTYPLYATNADIKELFHCGNSTIASCRKYIAENPQRYTGYGLARNLTNVIAFLDAYKYRDYPAEALPAYDPEKLAQVLGGLIKVWITTICG